MNDKHHFYPSVEIPDYWSPDEALTIVAFLRRLTSAIWAAYGPAMADLLCRSRPPTPATAIPFSPCDQHDSSAASDAPSELHDNQQIQWPF